MVMVGNFLTYFFNSTGGGILTTKSEGQSERDGKRYYNSGKKGLNESGSDAKLK